jgi:hypothetical protein
MTSSERRALYGAIGLRLLDALTNDAPIGRVQAHLDLQDSASWHPVAERVLVGPTGVVTCPGLGRCSHPAAGVVRHYRLRIVAARYRPLYCVTDDGVEFDAHPYDDFNPPAQYAATATDTILVPVDGYPFPAHVRVLRGVVADVGGAPVADALVSEGAIDRAITDERGTFALALRTAAENAPVQILVDHPRSGRSGAIAITMPADLGHSHTVQVA